MRLLTEKDLEHPSSLQVIWRIFDRAHGKTEDERSDKAYSTWDNLARTRGQEFDDYITEVRLAKLEVHTQDPEKRISDKELFSKILRGSGLPHKDRAQVKMNCGGVPDPERVETVLISMFPNMGKTERIRTSTEEDATTTEAPSLRTT